MATCGWFILTYEPTKHQGLLRQMPTSLWMPTIRLEDLLILASQYLQCDIWGLNRLNPQMCAAWISNLRVLQYHFDLAKFPWFVRALNTQQFAARIHMLSSNHINHGDSQFLVEWSHHAASMPLSPCDSSLIELIFLLAKELKNPHYCWL